RTSLPVHTLSAEAPATATTPERPSPENYMRPALGSFSFAEPAETTTVARVPFLASTLDGAAEQLVKYALSNRRNQVGLPVRLANAYSLACASQDAGYLDLLQGPGVNLPDGTPVAWAMGVLGDAPAEKVRGASFFRTVLQRGADRGLRHYFFGTSPETLDKMVRRVTAQSPGLRIAGASAPPMGSVEDILTESVIRSIGDARPDVVWVGLGSPKQDYVARILAERLGLPCIGVGAAFDFVAGTKCEAPRLLQRLGLEWTHRLLSEPRRLWRRYAFGNTRFAMLVAVSMLSRVATPSAPADVVADA
ncbi:WecB/TagA/CpsF family glycosyltransferase, partial [Georgenia sp. 10Sc9-8]|nr:WecB/TagA/CpsF family glycosyltransferase [Georgenia halotolerans]